MKVLYKSKDNMFLYIEDNGRLMNIRCAPEHKARVAGFDIPSVQDYAQASSKFTLYKLRLK